MLEKSGLNKNVVIMSTRDMKMLKIKRNISILISLITSMCFSYETIYIISFKTNITEWIAFQRFVFLLLSSIGTVLVFIYCSYHESEVDVQGNGIFSIKINHLSENWFKKLLSIFIFYFVISIPISSIVSFCAMSLDVEKMLTLDRAIIVILFYIGTIILCAFAHHNNLKFILKINQ